MEMIEVKTSELIGPALDWAVAKAEAWPVEMLAVSCKSDASTGHKMKATGYRLWTIDAESAFPDECSPSTDWSQGGPLVDSHKLTIVTGNSSGWCVVRSWSMGVVANTYPDGPTHLIASCRAIVAAKLGDTVSVPKELMQ